MKTFYSILSAVINPVSGEKISLGLVLSDGNTSIFDYSRNRLSLINSLINPESKKFIKQYIKSIESIINRIDINQDQHSIFDVEGKNLVINESYIGYLSTYSQNVISFSKPVSIDLKIEKGIFAALYSKFIDEETEASKTENKVHLAKSSFFPQIKNHFSTDKEFTAEYDSSVILPIKIDLIGKNEIYVIGQFLDLEKSPNHIKSNFYDYQQFTKIFEKSKKYLISAEPEKEKYPKQHYFWNEIRKQNSHDYVDITELERIKNYAKEHNVLPIE